MIVHLGGVGVNGVSVDLKVRFHETVVRRDGWTSVIVVLDSVDVVSVVVGVWRAVVAVAVATGAGLPIRTPSLPSCAARVHPPLVLHGVHAVFVGNVPFV